MGSVTLDVIRHNDQQAGKRIIAGSWLAAIED